MLNSNVITIREFRPTDKWFVAKTWLDGAWAGNEYFKEINEDVFKEIYQKFMLAVTNFVKRLKKFVQK